MFDFGFSEMLVVAVVALVVVGPQRLPKVARTVGHLLGRMQRYVSDVKADVSREMQLEELQKLQKEVKEQAQDLENSMRKQADAVESEFRSAEDSVRSEVEDVAAAVDKPVADATTPAASETPSADSPPEGEAAPRPETGRSGS